LGSNEIAGNTVVKRTVRALFVLRPLLLLPEISDCGTMPSELWLLYHFHSGFCDSNGVCIFGKLNSIDRCLCC